MTTEIAYPVSAPDDEAAIVFVEAKFPTISDLDQAILWNSEGVVVWTNKQILKH